MPDTVGLDKAIEWNNTENNDHMHATTDFVKMRILVLNSSSDDPYMSRKDIPVVGRIVEIKTIRKDGDFCDSTGGLKGLVVC